jgi:hemolysin D
MISVSDDAVQDDRLGLVYSVRLQLKDAELNVDGKLVALSPGMAASVEVRTGQRSIAEFLLSPIVQNMDESFRER